MIDAIDGLFASLLSPIISRACWLTGRSNFFFARALLLCGTFAWVASDIVPIVGGKPPGWLSLFFDLGWCIVSVPMCLHIIAELESNYEQGSTAMGIHYVSMRWVSIVRVFFMINVIQFLAVDFSDLSAVLSSSGSPLLALCAYFATDFHGRRPSAAKRLFRWAKSKLGGISMPEPQPLPSH